MSMALLIFALMFHENKVLLFEINEKTPALNETFLTVPNDAVFHQGKVYVADDSYSILVYSNGVIRDRIGRRGEGPGEFKHWPHRLEVIDNTIVSTDYFKLTRNFFSPNGTYLRRESIDRAIIHGDKRFKKIPYLQALQQGHRYIELDTGTELASLPDPTDEGYHLASSLIRCHQDRVYVIKRSGEIEIYSAKGEFLDLIDVNLGRFTAEMQLNVVYKAFRTHSQKTPWRRKIYALGLPIYDAAIEDGRFLWLLVSDEHKALEKHDHRPEVSWLFKLDLQTHQFTWGHRLTHVVDRIRINGEHLLFISSQDAFVQVYSRQGYDNLAAKGSIGGYSFK